LGGPGAFRYAVKEVAGQAIHDDLPLDGVWVIHGRAEGRQRARS
jgi:hypothetical protein